MNRGRTALALLVLLLAPLMPSAVAAPPTPAPWSPYDAISVVSDVALAAEGTTVAATLAKAVSDPDATNPTVPGVPGVPTDTAPTRADLIVLTVPEGFQRNGTRTSQTSEGRSHVAVSRDGSVVASVGFDRAAVSDASPKLMLKVDRIPRGANWSSATVTSHSVDVAGAPVELLVSDDGSRVVLVTNVDGHVDLRGFNLRSFGLEQAFRYTAALPATHVAASSGLERILLATRVNETGNLTYPALETLVFGDRAPVDRFVDRTVANGTGFSALAADRTAHLWAVGAPGKVHLFHRDRDDPFTFPTSGGFANVTRLALSEDGTRLAVATGANVLAAYNVTSAPQAAFSWNATLGGPVTGLQMNRTGGLLVAGVGGGSGGVHAFGDDATLLWKLNGDIRALSLNSAGTAVSYAFRNYVATATIPRAMSLETELGGEVADAKLTKPQTPVTFTAKLRNPGSAPERVRFELSDDFDGTLRAEPEIAYVRPDESLPVQLVVTPGASFSGDRRFNVTAVSLTSGLRDDLTLQLGLAKTLNVTLSANESDVRLLAGEERSLLLVIQNTGTKGTPVSLRWNATVTTGPMWSVQVDPTNLTLAPNSVTTARLTARAPAGAPNGTSLLVDVFLEGPEVADRESVAFRINPELGVLLDASGRVKWVEPGRAAHYNVTVTNTGSLPRQFEVLYDILDNGGQPWAVEMDSGTYRLDPGASETLAVRIVAPRGVQPGTDRVSVVVVARSLPDPSWPFNETAVESNLTLFANAVPPVTTTTPEGENDLPAPALAPVLLVLVGAAALRRRRA